jgi:DNA-directed RNA polymerase subunit RPC12/RpoP
LEYQGKKSDREIGGKVVMKYLYVATYKCTKCKHEWTVDKKYDYKIDEVDLPQYKSMQSGVNVHIETFNTERLVNNIETLNIENNEAPPLPHVFCQFCGGKNLGEATKCEHCGGRIFRE